jgi:hypothetical protein
MTLKPRKTKVMQLLPAIKSRKRKPLKQTMTLKPRKTKVMQLLALKLKDRKSMNPQCRLLLMRAKQTRQNK